MTRGFKTLLRIILLFAFVVKFSESYNSNYFDIRSLSLKPPFIDETLRNNNWEFGNSTIVEVNKFVRLTSSDPLRQGWLWSKYPLISLNWEIHFEFMIHGKTKKNGDGFAFFITKEKEEGGPVFGNRNKFTGLGVFFDTYSNSKYNKDSFPKISVMIGDGETEYDVNKDGEGSILGSCSMQIRQQNKPTRVKIVHIKNSRLEIFIRNDDSKRYQSCIKIDQPVLPDTGYLGFTASTNEATDNHDILKVITKGIVTKIPKNEKKIKEDNIEDPVETAKSSVSVFIWLFAICSILLYLYANRSRKYINKEYNHYA